ncbi:hypothetical protein BDV96DRAFT_141657 [Lophiotrema nucula]|uniref:Uncharacterized protein n=1 Tax=Lophiotrema nucula TaxID=690887 RepID=A0A6A5ZRI3_9PLEO|nr:hypothetical protein BDV96DRAFT_141657 [Lophiotrema nucula]
MRLAIVVAALVAAVTASPHPWAEAQFETVIATTTAPSSSIHTRRPNATGTGRHNPHKEPTPTFKLGCDCAKPIIPVDQFTPAEKCEFEYGAAMGCYFRAQGGCPSPTLACT